MCASISTVCKPPSEELPVPLAAVVILMVVILNAANRALSRLYR